LANAVLKSVSIFIATTLMTGIWIHKIDGQSSLSS